MAAHPFDVYLDAQPQPQRSTLEEVAARLRKLLPTAEECISYGMPAFKCDGVAVAGFAGFKRHCSYFPHSGEVTGHLTAELAGYDVDAGTLRFAVDRPLPVATLKALVTTRLRLIGEQRPRQGTARHFYADGRLQAKGPTRNGQLHGAWSWWRKDGSLLRTGSFRTGEQHGVWRTFDRSGALIKETTF